MFPVLETHGVFRVSKCLGLFLYNPVGSSLGLSMFFFEKTPRMKLLSRKPTKQVAAGNALLYYIMPCQIIATSREFFTPNGG